MSPSSPELAAEPIFLPDSVQAPARRTFWQRLIRHRLAQIGFALILFLLLAAFFAPWLSGHGPKEILKNGLNAVGEPHPPGEGFLLGADSLGRDVWARVLYGARISLRVAFYAMLTSVSIGTLVGLLSGYFGGWTDILLTRLTETVMSLPTVLLAISLFVLLPGDTPQQRFWKLLLAIGLVTWTGIARAVRGQTLALREREFIEAARALGCSNLRILFVHLLPNVLPNILVLATLATAQNILLESGLSYLGQGIEPSEPSLGGIIFEGQPFMLSAPWILLAPATIAVLAITGFNLLGRALEETLETRP